LHSEFFGAGPGGISRYAATPLIVALSPGHSGITRFCPWSTIMTGNHLDCAKLKIPKVAQTIGIIKIFIYVQKFREPLRRELPNVQIFMSDGPNPLT
jgi:hypothetical protein